ncbi:TIGR02757 family protein [Helicobacter sp. 23-1044]
MRDLKKLLDYHYNARNTDFELSEDKPDPLFALKKAVEKKYDFVDEIAVVCALLAYGNAKQILKTLLNLDFKILGDKNAILRAKFPHYRFQRSDDIKMLFLALSEIIACGGIKRIFTNAYKNAKLQSDSAKFNPAFEAKNPTDSAKIAESPVICGINAMIFALDSALKNQIISPNLTYSQNLAESPKISQNLTKYPQTSLTLPHGLKFLIGQRATNAHSSPLKRWNLFLRWMVRKDNIDFGFWGEVSRADLILPLDTHTFRLSQKLGLLKRKSYDLRSALEITANLGRFCADDPVKYDFALYRLGQEKML